MTQKSTKIDAKLIDVVSLIDENEVKSEMGEAFASFMLNPTVTWAKFVLTDDKTNANGERIPKQEFVNLIRSGIHMPVKMALGEISPGHPGTKPLGTITHLKEVETSDGASAIIALAALWGEERPADVEFIKQRFAENKPVDVSWEVLYEDATFNAEASSMDLLGTVLRAATIVGNPAYEGRTQFLSISAKKKGDTTAEDSVDDNPNTHAEDELNELEKLQAELDRVTAELETFKTTQTTALAEKDVEIERLTKESTEKDTELTTLKEFKQGIEAEANKKEKLASVKTKFSEAQIEKDEQFFVDNEEKLLAMSDEQLDFMVQEMATLAESKTSTASKKTTKIPAVLGTENEEVDLSDPKVLGKYLREQRGKK
jgi:hypothetical protein